MPITKRIFRYWDWTFSLAQRFLNDVVRNLISLSTRFCGFGNPIERIVGDLEFGPWLYFL